MNKILITYIVLILNCSSNSQWQYQYGHGTSLLDCDFINENTGWVCGDGGQILKTTNSGVNWVVQQSGSFNRLEGIDAIDEDTVYAVGWFQTILKSTNGGTNWIAIRNGTTNTLPSFFKCFFLNSNTGWLLRSGGWILRTINGGDSFDSSYVNIGFPYDIYFKDALTGVLCGGGAFVAKSTNGGVDWVQIPLPLHEGGMPRLFRLSFIGNSGWTIGEGGSFGLGRLVYRTTDFGSSWDSIGRVPYPSDILNYSVCFTSSEIGYAGGTYGYIFKTTNGGFNWIEQWVPINGFRKDIWFANDSLGWAVGGGGYILQTTNGGTYVSIELLSYELPIKHSIENIYPNPFNSETNIRLKVAIKDKIKIVIYDLLGREISILINKELSSGTYDVRFNAANLSSGVYFCNLISTNINLTKVIVLSK